jgi:ATPase subunit of ABC transporter with duplicated ATPase domains
VGANGIGKTTLARLIAGELRPTVGRVWLEPESAVVVVCRQEEGQLSSDMARFAANNEREYCRQRGLMGLNAIALERFDDLSPGERKRWQLAAVLASQPDVLIVDEPTNHLDANGRTYLLRALKQFRGVGIAISHDREFLDALTTATLRIHDATVVAFPAGYSAARLLWRAEAEQAEQMRQAQCLRQKRLQERVYSANCDKQAAHKQRSARTRMKNIHDHDGSSFAVTGRAANGETSISRRLSVMSAQLERQNELIPEYVVDKTVGKSIFVGYEPAPKRRILTIAGEDLRAGDRVILHDVSVTLERGARVHLKGDNGVGKTTLLKALLARSSGASERILYLPQELDAEQVRELKTEVLALERETRGRTMAILAALGVDPDRILSATTYSPGEARKLKLAFGLGSHAWALVLDEPTNHLDLPSIERLEQALVAYPGALLLVCHDAAFVRNCTNLVWEIRDGRLMT